MGALLGLMFGVGSVLVAMSVSPRWRAERAAARAPALRRPRGDKLRDQLAAADLHGVRPATVWWTAAALALVIGVVMLAVTGTYPIAAVFAGFAGWGPFVLVRRRAANRREELRGLWPDAVDNLGSSIRAGLSLPEALSQLGIRGPVPLRPAFSAFGADYRATGRFTECLDVLKARLADPVADRIIEALRLAREVGGTDLGRLLRTLSAFLREDAHTRAELVARQSWTVNAARLAVAAPWIVLALLSLQSNVTRQYNSQAGIVVLAVGLGCSVLAYRLMMRLGRLPEDVRVLR